MINHFVLQTENGENEKNGRINTKYDTENQKRTELDKIFLNSKKTIEKTGNQMKEKENTTQQEKEY